MPARGRAAALAGLVRISLRAPTTLRRALLAAAATASLAPAHALALATEGPAVTRISPADCRYAARSLFANLAAGLDERLVIGTCEPKGRLSRICSVTLGADRYLVRSRYANPQHEVLAVVQRA